MVNSRRPRQRRRRMAEVTRRSGRVGGGRGEAHPRAACSSAPIWTRCGEFWGRHRHCKEGEKA
eukprot:200147-Chlamydomonas_euryale.AAC.3